MHAWLRHNLHNTHFDTSRLFDVAIPLGNISAEATEAAQELVRVYLPEAHASVAAHYIASWITCRVQIQSQHTRGPPQFWNWHLALGLLLLEIAGIAEAFSASGEEALNFLRLHAFLPAKAARNRPYTRWVTGTRAMPADVSIPGARANDGNATNSSFITFSPSLAANLLALTRIDPAAPSPGYYPFPSPSDHPRGLSDLRAPLVAPDATDHFPSPASGTTPDHPARTHGPEPPPYIDPPDVHVELAGPVAPTDASATPAPINPILSSLWPPPVSAADSSEPPGATNDVSMTDAEQSPAVGAAPDHPARSRGPDPPPYIDHHTEQSSAPHPLAQ